MTSRHLPAIPVLLAISLAYGCAEGDPSRDLDADLAEWTLSAEPTLTLGGVGAVGAQMFQSIVGATWAGDGSILVADAGADQLRRFAPDGGRLATLGRQGRGPGEFGNAWNVFAGPGDTIWGYDQLPPRLVGFHGGEHQRDLPLDRMTPVGWVGAVLVGTGVPRLDRGPDPRAPGMHRDPWRVVALTADGARADTLARGLSGEMYLSDDLIWGSPLLPRDPHVALGSDFVAYGDGAAPEVLLLELGGDTLGVLPVGEVAGTTLEQVAEARRVARLEQFPPERRPRVRQNLETMFVPDRISDITDLVVDDADRIWIRRIVPPGDSLAPWDVFDRSGTAVARIEIPETVRVRAIRGDDLLATARDALDVPLVLVYRILR